MTTAEIAAAVGSSTQVDAVVEGVAVDSRLVREDQLFVPLRGATTDGHRFLGGITGVHLTEEPPTGPLAIRVPDTLVALQQLARVMRLRVPRAVGITGSVGKTTTKDLLSAALAPAFAVSASIKSFNNHVGVPLTVLNAPDATQVLILEIGTNAPGEIGALSALAQPTTAVVTRVSAAHLAGFGSLDGVACEKSDLVRSLGPDGVAVLNADDERVLAMRSLAPQAITFGAAADVSVRIERLTEDLLPVLTYDTPWGTTTGTLAARGRHQVTNAGAAVAVAGLLGVPLEDAVGAMSDVSMSAGRMAMTTLPGGALLIDDSYNANPESILAALASLRELPRPRRVAVLGRMAELGDATDSSHRQVADFAAAAGIRLVGYQTPAYGGEVCADAAEVLAALGSLGADLALLVKGSRAAALETVVAAVSA